VTSLEEAYTRLTALIDHRERERVRDELSGVWTRLISFILISSHQLCLPILFTSYGITGDHRYILPSSGFTGFGIHGGPGGPTGSTSVCIRRLTCHPSPISVFRSTVGTAQSGRQVPDLLDPREKNRFELLKTYTCGGPREVCVPVARPHTLLLLPYYHLFVGGIACIKRDPT
jgi:hypothetical protein